MNEVELTKLFVEYRETAERLSALEGQIRDAVLELQSSQKMAGVTATFFKPSIERNYEAAVKRNISTLTEGERDALLQVYSTITTKVRWKDVAEHLSIAEAAIPLTEKPARVVIKL